MPENRRFRRVIEWLKGDPDESGEPEPFTPGSCCLAIIVLVSAALLLLYVVYTR